MKAAFEGEGSHWCGQELLFACLCNPPRMLRIVSSARRVAQQWHACRRFSTPAPSDAQRHTIYALSTPPGKGGIAVVRVSGPHAVQVYQSITRSTAHSSPRFKPKRVPRSWAAEYREIVDPITDDKLDDAVVLFFQGASMYVFYPAYMR